MLLTCFVELTPPSSEKPLDNADYGSIPERREFRMR